MNLREDKHWSYGAHSLLVPARGQRLFLVSAPVQTDKTTESVAELQRELGDLVGSCPITPDELAKAQRDQTLKLSGAWETLGHVADSVAEMVTFGLPSDGFTCYPEKVSGLTMSDNSPGQRPGNALGCPSRNITSGSGKSTVTRKRFKPASLERRLALHP